MVVGVCTLHLFSQLSGSWGVGELTMADYAGQSVCEIGRGFRKLQEVAELERLGGKGKRKEMGSS